MTEHRESIGADFHPINVNEYASLTLSPIGHEIYRRHYGSIIYDRLRENQKIPPDLELDENGITRFQLWEMIKIFGPSYEQSLPPFEGNVVTIRPEKGPEYALTLEDPLYVDLTATGRKRLQDKLHHFRTSGPLTEMSLGSVGKLFGDEFDIGKISPSVGIDVFVRSNNTGK